MNFEGCIIIILFFFSVFSTFQFFVLLFCLFFYIIHSLLFGFWDQSVKRLVGLSRSKTSTSFSWGYRRWRTCRTTSKLPLIKPHQYKTSRNTLKEWKQLQNKYIKRPLAPSKKNQTNSNNRKKQGHTTTPSATKTPNKHDSTELNAEKRISLLEVRIGQLKQKMELLES